MVFTLLSICLSTIKVKGLRLWSLINTNVISQGGQTKLMFDDLKKFKPNNKSVFVLGSSHAYRGYDPRLFNQVQINLFNMGTSGQNMKDTYVLLKLNKQKIHQIILDIYPGVLQDITEESTLMLIQNANTNSTALEILKNNITINSVNNMVSRWLDVIPSGIPCQEKYIYNGYIQRDSNYNGGLGGKFDKFEPGANFVYLDSILKFASALKMRTCIASHPLKWNEAYKIYYQTTYLPELNKVLLKYNKIPFFDFTFEHSNQDSLFSDANHLNQKGVNYYNAKLIEKLKKFGVFEDSVFIESTLNMCKIQ